MTLIDLFVLFYTAWSVGLVQNYLMIWEIITDDTTIPNIISLTK
jgi:hypothetical protein